MRFFDPIDDLIKKGEKQKAAKMLADQDEEAFALLKDNETKCNYIEVLIDAWTWQAQEIAIVEIFKTLNSPADVK